MIEGNGNGIGYGILNMSRGRLWLGHEMQSWKESQHPVHCNVFVKRNGLVF